jgi:hypothetical protein
LNPGDSLGIPEKLVDIIVTDNLVVISLSLQELAIDDFVRLIAQESVQRLDDASQVQSLRYGLHPVLTFGGSVVVVCTFEDEAETLWYESNLRRFTPTKEEEGDLSESIVLRHIVHRSPPSRNR